MNTFTADSIITAIMKSYPQAYADIRGSKEYPTIIGTVLFYKVDGITAVLIDVKGLPTSNECGGNIFGFYIHEGAMCTRYITRSFCKCRRAL